MYPTEQDFEKTAVQACEKEGWPMPDGLAFAEGSLALACVKAGYALAASLAPSLSVGATPALLADAELAELNEVIAAVCKQHCGYNMDFANQGKAIEKLEMLWGTALPGLLARLAAAEAFKAQVLEVLTMRGDAAHALFLADLEENEGEGPTAGAEAGDEISKIAQALGLVLPAPTVKGGQPNV